MSVGNNYWPAKVETMRKIEAKLRSALQFCHDIAEEEYSYARGGVGTECALRHIIRKTREALDAKEGMIP